MKGQASPCAGHEQAGCCCYAVKSKQTRPEAADDLPAGMNKSGICTKIGRSAHVVSSLQHSPCFLVVKDMMRPLMQSTPAECCGMHANASACYSDMHFDACLRHVKLSGTSLRLALTAEWALQLSCHHDEGSLPPRPAVHGSEGSDWILVDAGESWSFKASMEHC